MMPPVLVGREGAQKRIARLLAAQHAVGLVGVAGIGKTSLARAVAARRNATWISCASGWRADALAAHVEHALRLRPDLGFAPSAAERGARIASALGRGARLLVLDDVHLVPDVPALLSPLVRALDRGHVLWTSRRQIALDPRAQAECFVLEVDPLDPKSATALARRVLVARGQDPRGAARLALVARGHPLAIKLVAAHGGKSGPVPALLGAMLEGLGKRERAALLEIAVHRIPVPVALPRGLEDGLLVHETPAGLVAHDLVRETVGTFSPEVHARAAQRYAARAATDPLAAREEVHHRLLAGDVRGAARALDRAALALWNVRDLGELRRLIDALAAAGARLGTSTRIADAILRSREGRHDDARAVLEALGPLGRIPRRARVPFLVAVARAAYARGDRAELETVARSLLSIAPGRDPRDWLRPVHLFVFGLLFEGRAGEARVLVDRYERRLGRSHPLLDWMRGDVALCEGRPRDAVASYERAVGSGEGALPRFDLAFLRSNIADAWLDLGEASTALAEIESAIASIAPIDLADAEAALGIWRARALAALGRKKEALAILDFATLELRSRPLQRVAYTEALLERGRLRTQGGSARGARQDLEEAIALSSATGARVLHARARIRLAELEIREGNHGRAARLLDLAAADAAVAPVEAAVEIARARLGIARGTLAEAERSARRAVERARGIPALQGLAERELRRAVGRDRSDGAASDEELVLDVSRCEAISSGRPVDLSSTKVIFRLVEALARAGRPLSKAAVFAAVWARRYRADLHDRNVYETVRRARRLLGLPERAATGRVALVSSEEGYALVGAVRIVGVDTPGADVTPSEREARRARIVELAAAGPIGNADVRRALGVFRTTATEDLAALANAGVLCRVGAGRGARYARVE